MCVEAGASLSSIGFEMTGGARDCWVAALTFLGRPLRRGGMADPDDAVVSWGRIRSDKADPGPSVIISSGIPSCRVILVANASSTRLASSAERRFAVLLLVSASR